jgi:hypothetical protein
MRRRGSDAGFDKGTQQAAVVKPMVLGYGWPGAPVMPAHMLGSMDRPSRKQHTQQATERNVRAKDQCEAERQNPAHIRSLLTHGTH